MTEPRYDITGPGIVRAMREAQSANKKIAFVYDHDNLGRLLQVGYFLKDQRIKSHSQPKITWFDPSEIQINIVNTPVRDFNLAALDLEFSHPKDNERHFLLSLTSDKNTRVILRNIFRIHKNLVTGFVIQAELHSTADGKVKCHPFVRYDHAHGFIHRDMIASDGSKTKHELGTQDTKGAIVLALEEIIENLNLWLHQLGYKPLDADVISQPRVIQEMDKAKSKLLELHDNPHKINAVQSTYTWLKEHPDYHERI
ncbi:MAG: hypothetical protein ISS54_07435 [Dehalococcoidia bacterium]|nr:hypothetical protein [Dehalococcoidia bacterium]